MIASSPSSPDASANKQQQPQQHQYQQQQIISIFPHDADDDIFSVEEPNGGGRNGSNTGGSSATESSASGTTATDVDYWEEHKRKWRSNSKGNNFNIMRFVSSSSRSSGCPNVDSYLGDGSDDNPDFNPKDYSLVFEQVLKDRECSELFLTFLKVSKAEEPFEFIIACDEYKKVYSKWRENNMEMNATKITTTTSSSSHDYTDDSLDNQPMKTMDKISVVTEKSISSSTSRDDLNHQENNKDDPSKVVEKDHSNISTPTIETSPNTNVDESRDQTSFDLLSKQLKTSKEQIYKLMNKVKKEIIERFIIEQAEKELHRGPLKTDLLKSWLIISEMHKDLIKEETKKYSITELKSKNTIVQEICNKLDPNVIFRDLYNSVHLDLQVDSFPWFCKHPDVLYFLKRKGEEYTRSVAVKNYSFNILDWRIKESDIKDKVIKREHFYFGFSLLLEDTKDWKVIRDKRGLKVLASKQVYTFDKALASRMKLTKFSTTIDCPLEKFWNIFTNIENQQKLDINSEIQVKECNTNVSTHNATNPFAFGVCETVSKLPFMATRKSRYIYTAIEEPSIDAIFVIGHSLQDESVEKESETATFSKEYFFYLFTNLKETKQTRVEGCQYSDLKLILTSRKKFLVKQYKLFYKLIKSLSLSSSTTSHNDSLNYNKILQCNRELNVSYYDSWLKLKKNQPNK